MRRGKRFIATLLVALTGQAGGCIYVPTFEHGLVSGRAMIADKDIAALQPGVMTREDMLLRFGDPGERLQDDEFFCYRWERVQGWFAVGGGGAGAAADIGKVHYFCARFSADNVYLRGQVIEAVLFGSAKKQRDSILKAWQEGAAATPPAGSSP